MAETVEYLGRQPNSNQGIDWQQAAASLGGAIKNVDDSRKARKAADESLLQESERLVNETEQPKSQTLDTFLLNGSDVYKRKALEWNKALREGKIKRADYNSRMANGMEYWKSLSTAIKSFDQRISQSIQRQQVGEDGTMPPASVIEAETQAFLGGLSQLKDKNLIVGDDGRLSVGRYGPNGELLSAEDVKYINNPANIEFNRTDLSGMVQAEVKNWGDWSIGRVSDTRQNPQFIKSEARLVDALTSSPRSAASILVDNTDGEYQVFFTPEDKAAKIQRIKDLDTQMGVKRTDAEIESQLIQMRQDENGDYQPVLSQKQMEEAKKLVKGEVEIQLSREVTPYQGGGSSYDASEARDIQNEIDSNLEGYKAARKAWNTSDYSGLRSGYEYKRSGTGDNYKIDVYKINTNPKTRDQGSTLIKTITSPEGLAEYAFNGDPNTNISKYKEGKNEFARRGLGDDRKKSSITPEQFDAQWANLKKGQTLVGPDGKTYTKK